MGSNYKGLHHSDHAETVKIVYDASKVSLQELLAHYFRIIDPTSLNKQGNDAGRQYRKLISDGLIQDKAGQISLTSKGIDLSNSVLCRFV